MLPVAERYARVNQTPGKSSMLPVPSLPPELGTSAPPSSSKGSSRLSMAQNREPVTHLQKRKAETEGRLEPVKRRKEVKTPVMNLDIQEMVNQMKENAENDKDKQRLIDMPFVGKALIELGEQ